MRNLYSFRENTLHALQQEGRNLGMRRPLVTEMVTALFAKIASWNVTNCCTFREHEQMYISQRQNIFHIVYMCNTVVNQISATLKWPLPSMRCSGRESW